MTATQLDNALRAAIQNDPRSLRQLAADAGISYPSVSLYLAGNRGLNWDTAAKLLAALGFTLQRDT